MTTIQQDIFGNSHAVNPKTGRAIDASNLDKFCNLCCIAFANDVLAETGRSFYYGFHVCERCAGRLALAAQEQSRVTRYKEVDFLIAPETIAIAVAGSVIGFIGTQHQVFLGKPYEMMGVAPIDDEDVCMSLYALAADVGVISDKSIAINETLIDRMVVEMYENVAYNRLGSETD